MLRVGFVASLLTEDLAASRSYRLRNATPERLDELTRRNLATLDRVVTFLERHPLGMHRITGNLVRFASHP
jgi:UV DNA damage repair endonuclease